MGELDVGEVGVDTQRLQQAAAPEGYSKLCGSVGVDVLQGLVPGVDIWTCWRL